MMMRKAQASFFLRSTASNGTSKSRIREEGSQLLQDIRRMFVLIMGSLLITASVHAISFSSSATSSTSSPASITTLNPSACKVYSHASSSESSSSSRGGEGATEDMRGYDHHPSMFAPSGRIPQVEYAREAVSHGRPLIGIRAKDGVVLVGRKSLESKKLQDTRLRQKLFRVDDHILVGVTGMTADALALVRAARSYAQDYLRTYGEAIPVRHLAEYVCDVKHTCTMVPHRPFGVSLLIAGWDGLQGYQLYKTDPSASFEAWKAVAVGEKADGLTTRLANSLLQSEAGEDSKESGKGASTTPWPLEASCGLACEVALDGIEGPPPSPSFSSLSTDESSSSKGKKKEKEIMREEKEGEQEDDHEVRPLEAYSELLEMGVVKGEKVYLLTASDVKEALKGRKLGR